MRSRTTPEFRAALQNLPPPVQARARAAYRQFEADPAYPGLRFKPISGTPGVWSARVGLDYRVLALRDRDLVTWFWIGSHADYDQLVRRR